MSTASGAPAPVPAASRRPLGVGLPRAVRIPADHLPFTPLPEHDLHGPALVARHHQRLPDLAIEKDDRRAASGLPKRLDRLGRVQGSGRDRLAEHPVVAEPLRIRGRRAPARRRFLHRREVPADAEQRMAGGRALAGRGREIQYRSRWKGYVGSAIRCRRSPVNRPSKERSKPAS